MSLNVIMSDDVFVEICDLLNIQDRASDEITITLAKNEPVRVENRFYPLKGEDE